jgi:GNAT superfamily N-acetyltransferase
MTANSLRLELFQAGAFRAVELVAADIARLQRFFDANPEYFLLITGEPATPEEAHEELRGALPDGFSYTKKWILGFVDERDDIAGMANVISDLIAPHVWHLGLFIVATRLHGSGVAALLYAGLEAWIREAGAQWLRLGVVQGNDRAERFWERCGYVEMRVRQVEMGKRTNTVRVMAKPLAGGELADYLAQVPRDRRDAD